MSRARMKRKKRLKLRVGPSLARAFTEEEKTAMIAEARRRATLPNGSKHVYPALCIAFDVDFATKRAAVCVGWMLTSSGAPSQLASNRKLMPLLGGSSR